MSTEQVFTIIFQDKEFHQSQPLTVTDFLNQISYYETVAANKSALDGNIDNRKIEAPIVCKLNSILSDLSAIITSDTELQLLDYADQEAQTIFKHSSAHILGYAILMTYPDALISSGPPTDTGFYYDVLLPNNTLFNEESYIDIQKNVSKILKLKLKFIPETFTKSELLKLFGHNKYKTHYISQMGDDESSTIYKLGEFNDFCKGPHIPNTNFVKELIITHHGGSYFLGDVHNDKLTRIYGVSFPNKGGYRIYKENMELAKLRNHRVIGREMDLFLFHEYSPGSCFFLPKGTHIYNKLMELIREQYKIREFKEVITPNIYSVKIWEQSGHLENYKEHIFFIKQSNGDTEDDVAGKVEKKNSIGSGTIGAPVTPNSSSGIVSPGSSTDITNSDGFQGNVDSHHQYALKPMNCPGHCLIFSSQSFSYKDLPIRYADFGVLHRNELSGCLTGLTRVRRFSQDDAHIFCTLSQLKTEIDDNLDFMHYILDKIFGFKYELCLSTRPSKFLGTLEEWDFAETQLKFSLSKYKYKLNPGDGAFYGPKIDINLTDSLGKQHQCSTIQLDFQLPKRFNLCYINNEGNKITPVIIHRALLGSIERFMAILLENFGKFKIPFWLTPNQIAIINMSGSEEYINKVVSVFGEFQYYLFDNNQKASKNIKTAVEKGYSIILLIGKIEEQSGKVKLYKKDGEYDILELREKLRLCVRERLLETDI
ncbi:Threonine--tRNA ligase, cytoplasmic [Cucumispora dikerogammari]|nr:Threonine--tRNA ligase, cytoplasmic [Cucumispora dikerogammari]